MREGMIKVEEFKVAGAVNIAKSSDHKLETGGGLSAQPHGRLRSMSRLMQVKVIVLLAGSAVAGLAQLTISEYSITTSANNLPSRIIAGPDGNLWFTENLRNKIGRITPTGAITEFAITTPGSSPIGITSGPDGNLWFTEYSGNKIGRITTSGVITEFGITTPGSSPIGITSGPDGNLWFTEQFGNRIGRITIDGVMKEFPLAKSIGGGLGDAPDGITSGPDGNLWFTELLGGRIGRITTAGVITEFSGVGSPDGIASGPDGNLWFAEQGGQIGRITTSGVVTRFPITTTAGSLPVQITNGPDGNLWFTEYSGKKIGRITTSGVIAEFPITPVSANSPDGIGSGPDGKLWFTDGNKIGSLGPVGPIYDTLGTPAPLIRDAANPVTITSACCTWSSLATRFTVPQAATLSGFDLAISTSLPNAIAVSFYSDGLGVPGNGAALGALIASATFVDAQPTCVAGLIYQPPTVPDSCVPVFHGTMPGNVILTPGNYWLAVSSACNSCASPKWWRTGAGGEGIAYFDPQTNIWSSLFDSPWGIRVYGITDVQP